MRTKHVRFTACLISIVPLLLLPAEPVKAQGSQARLRVAQENFRKSPNGKPLATVFEGAELEVVGVQRNWVEVELSGWIWGPAVRKTDREGYDLAVRTPGGANLRLTPNGKILGRLLEGFLLRRMGSSGNWLQVHRRGWVWAPSLDLTTLASAPAAVASQPQASGGDVETDDGDETSRLLTAPGHLPVHATPDGDTLAVVRPGARAQILGRAGDWIRIRMDGWVYGPAALDSLVDVADTGDLTPALLRADPGRYKGALIRWRVQFVSLRQAEPARSDFEEGEPFILARGPQGDIGFVYLAVPEGLIEIAERLQPLDYVTVLGRVRTGRSTLLGSPVIDLTDIEVENR